MHVSIGNMHMIFRKIAVVANGRLVAWSAWLARAFIDAEIQIFENYDLASDWVDAKPERLKLYTVFCSLN